MNELALFAGAGGGILGGKLLGWRTVCAVEWEPYAASVLVARQNDGFLSPFPIWDDVQTFDGKPWRGIVDVVSGGFPCQDISAAGKGAGINGERSGMWKEMARIIGEVRPRFAFVENSPMLITRGLECVLADLTAMGYDSRWGVVSAADVGANHKRERIWIIAKRGNIFSHAEHNGFGRWEQQQKGVEKETRKLANSNSRSVKTFCKPGILEQSDFERETNRYSHGSSKKNVSDTLSARPQGSGKGWKEGDKVWENSELWGAIAKHSWWHVEPNVGRVADGVAARVDRLKAIGNGQVPLCAATAWKILTSDEGI